MIKIISILFIFIIFIDPCFAKKQPKWMKTRPTSSEYFIGIGSSKRTSDKSEYQKIAKSRALDDLSSEITSTISSEVLDVIVLKSGVTHEEAKIEINMSTQAELEDYEIVDTYKDKNQYYVYYRLHKKTYYQKQEEKRKSAVSLSLDLFKKGKTEEARCQTDSDAINKSIQYYIQALEPIQKYYGDALKATYLGKQIFIYNEIFSSLQNILSKISLKSKNQNLTIKPMTGSSKALTLSATYSSGNYPIKNIPIHFISLNGLENIPEMTTTDANGNAKSEIIKIDPIEKHQIIQSIFNIENYFTNDFKNAFIKKKVKAMFIPSIKFIVDIVGPSIYIQTSEKNIGAPLSVNIIEPKVKNYLIRNGCTFTDNISNADIKIIIYAESRLGSPFYGQYVSFVDATISIINLSTGKEIYKNIFQNKKGIHLSYIEAGIKVYQEIGVELTKDNNLYFDILNSVY